MLDNWEPELLEVMQSLGNNLVAKIFERTLEQRNSSPTSSVKRPEPGQGSEANQELRQAWIKSKWVQRNFVQPFLCPPIEDDRNWLFNLFFSWLSQVRQFHHQRVQIIKPNHLPIIDRRRVSTNRAVTCSTRSRITLGKAFLFVFSLF